jgi:hypothetical protein
VSELQVFVWAALIQFVVLVEVAVIVSVAKFAWIGGFNDF